MQAQCNRLTPAMSDSPALHRCPICFKTYKRREHLQRHRNSHNKERPHRCGLCSASFQRTDVLKRHLQTCDGPAGVSSARRRACDRCVRQKKACNSSQPCQNCERRTVVCEYSNSAPPTSLNLDSRHHLQQQLISHPQLESPPLFGHVVPGSQYPDLGSHHHDTGSVSTSFEDAPFDNLDALIQQAVSSLPLLESHDIRGDWLGMDLEFPHGSVLPEPFQHGTEHQCGDYPTAGQNNAVTSSPASDYRGYQFTFLYNFTSKTGLVASFDCGTLEQRQQVVAAFNRSYLEQQQHDALGLIPPPFAPIEDPMFFSASSPTGTRSDPRLVSWSSWLQNPIILKLQQVVLLVKNVVTVRPNNSAVTLTWSPALEQRCLDFFSPPRFAKFIELYWSVWHPNVNFLHRPSFDPNGSKSILLAAMALMGACVSPDSDDNEDAKMWFNCVEEMVFADDDFCSDIDPAIEAPPPSSAASRRRLQSLQAAYIVCLYQNWEGTDASKRRIRRHRFSTVVSVARDLKIETARHFDYSKTPKHEFNWNEFIVREEFIRLFLWVFLFDTAFVIFNNLPHRMVIKEMKMHMASPEACFQAATADECIENIHTWMAPPSPFCSVLLCDAVEKMFIDTFTTESRQRFSQLGPLNLFTIVSAFHYMIFQHQNLFGVEGQLVPIRNGLRNWIEVWELYFDSSWSSIAPHGLLRDDCFTPETMWRRVGFMQWCADFWLLGSLLTDRISTATAYSREERDSRQAQQPSDDSSANPPLARSIEPILDKYDQTSMRQVNDLISAFQKFHVD
ncbi:hypothetical protein B0H63DRAFT_456453 [Podospora didyma]|uniref:Uncharacterized protein n=1 Tax=Podospora didyma TaxID=330526 RepID=A0AAE0U6E6_9PEZI|nr:hypothetical protein B0H63DRAFT_456453 [Podospora didyma]